jgi:hypothetical protein
MLSNISVPNLLFTIKMKTKQMDKLILDTSYTNLMAFKKHKLRRPLNHNISSCYNLG